MTIRQKTLLWFLIPSVLMAISAAVFCYYYTRKVVEQNIFNQLEIAADELYGSVYVFLNGKKSRIADFGSDGFIRDYAEEITSKDGRLAYHTSTLSAHLITNKKSLSPNIFDVFVVDFKGKIIASTDGNRIGEDVSGKEYFLEAASHIVYNTEPYHDIHSKEMMINFSIVLLSKIEQEPIGVIVNQIKYEQKEDKGLDSALIPQDGEPDYSLFIAVNKARIMDFSSDGFIRDSTEEITGRDKRVLHYTDLLNEYLDDSKEPLDDDILTSFIVDLDGNVISSTDIDQIGENVSNKAYFLKTIRGGSSISDLHYYPNYEQNTFEVARILLSNESQASIGVIVHRYNGDNLRKITRSGIMGRLDNVEQLEGLGATGEVYIVNNKKLMITESRFMEDAILKQVVDTEGVNAALDYKAGMIGIYNDYRGKPTLGVSRYIVDLGWVVLAEKDVSEAFAPVVWLRNFFIIMGASGILIMVIISILISTEITKSIKKLIKGTKRIAGGDLEQPIEINEMGGEIKELGESFNMMMRDLGKSTHENRLLFLQVKKGRDEWRKTFDTITDIITIHDENHKIIMANRAFYEKFKIDKEELPGKICLEILHGTDSKRHGSPLERSIKSSQPESEVVDDPHMGGVFIKSTYPMKDEKGEIYAYVHLAKDITLQKELQTELVEKAAALEKANKELEDFVYLTSHDLKEPLFVIGGFTSRLSLAYNDVLDDKGRMFIRRIKVNVEKMNQRIHEIMEVLKAGKIEYNFKDNDSAAIVKDVIDTLQEKILENKITLSVQDNLPTIFCDDVRIKDVFSNLLTNAIKYMGNGTLPVPHLEKREGLWNIRIDCKRNGEYYKFCVEDKGIGIQADYQKQIFKIFKRLNDIEVEGTGVGLSIVKKIVERHKGDIWVESPVRDGKGSRFCFTIPILELRD